MNKEIIQKQIEILEKEINLQNEISEKYRKFWIDSEIRVRGFITRSKMLEDMLEED